MPFDAKMYFDDAKSDGKVLSHSIFVASFYFQFATALRTPHNPHSLTKSVPELLMKFTFVECDSFARFHRTYVMHIIIVCHASWNVTTATAAYSPACICLKGDNNNSNRETAEAEE